MKLKTISRTLALSAGLLLTGALATPALAQELAVKNWKAYTLVPTAQYWDINKAHLDDGTVGFTFPQVNETSYTVYLLANYNGDLKDKTIIAKVKMNVTGGPLFWTRTTACANSGLDAYVRLEFQSVPSTGNYDPSDYWFSTGTSPKNSLNLSVLAASNDSLELSVSTADLEQWSNLEGHRASEKDYEQQFYKALKNVKQVSLAFGSPCSYGSGVAVNPGSATFQLLSYTIE